MKNTRRVRGRGYSIGPEETVKLKAAFLEDYRDHAILQNAAALVGVSRRTVYDWKQKDPEFAEAFAEASEDANDVIRAEIRRRGLEGWDEPVYQGGKEVGMVRKYDASLLKLLAQSRMPEFRQQVDVTTGGHALVNFDRIIDDPDTAALACQLAERAQLSAADGLDAGGSREDYA